MPIYEYRCEACGHELEAMQKMSDERLTDCPECGRPELVKLLSAAGFRLKGGGWYEADFKGGAKKNVAAESPAAPACGAGGGGCKACCE
ncbi:MAG: zinc ribbon domain-containing protein [Candidatus Sedimenticola endophacoides]